MNRVIMAVILFALGAYAAARTHDGYREGKMPLLISSRVSPFVFDRFQVPLWFWASTTINVTVAAGMVVAGILIVAVGAHS